MNVIYTSPDGMFRVVKSGLFFPQERDVRTPEFGRIRSERELQAIREGGICTIHDSGFCFFAGSYRQFGTKYNGHKSFKTEKGAVAFVDRCSENLQEV